MGKEPLALTVKDRPGEIVAWACGQCRYVAASKEQAEQCCGMLKCSVCGKPAESTRSYKVYSWTCRECQDKKHAEIRWNVRQKAEIIAYGDYSGPVYWEEYERFEDSMDAMFDVIRDIYYEFQESIDESFMDWIDRQTFWSCDEMGLGPIHADHLVENLLEEHHEDAELSNEAFMELEKFLKEWHERWKNDVITWEPNNKRRLMVHKDIWLEMAKECEDE